LINSYRSAELIFAESQACKVKRSCELLADTYLDLFRAAFTIRTSFLFIFSSRINELEWSFINIIKQILFYFLYWHDSIIICKGNFITIPFMILFFFFLFTGISHSCLAVVSGLDIWIYSFHFAKWYLTICNITLRNKKKKKTGECCNVQKTYKDIKLHSPLYWNEHSRMGTLHPPIICISLFNMQTSHPVSAE